jgi:hypothetical protein
VAEKAGEPDFRAQEGPAKQFPQPPASPMVKTRYQLSWKSLPGLRGMSCSEFRAVPTEAPDTERGVAIECASEAECAAFLKELETHFGPQRFSNDASAFETVKTYVMERSARNQGA